MIRLPDRVAGLRPKLPVLLAIFAVTGGCVGSGAASAQSTPAPTVEPTYADIADLADQADVVPIVTIADQATVEPERSPGLQPGMVRLYIEADTQALLAGSRGLGESIAYLADVPTYADGKAPKLKKMQMILFADSVPGRVDQVALVERDAQLPATDSILARTRSILSEMADPYAPPHVTGLRDVLSVQGNLAGEWETQLFLATDDGSPASITIINRPGQRPRWGVSWSEIIDQAARPPEHDSLPWYRLACSLPPELPRSAMLSASPSARRQAMEDYTVVMRDLGPCTRTR